LNTITCPNCGSDQVKTLSEDCKGQLTLGSEFNYKAIAHECAACFEKGDFTGEGDDRYLESLTEAKKSLQKALIEDIGDMGFKMAYVERAFELPQRTLARWKNGDLSAANLALLRIIKTIPWVVDAADHGFSQSYVTQRMLAFLSEKLAQSANDTGYVASSRVDFTNPSSIRFEISMDKKVPINTEELISSSSNINLAAS
jgi:hypothetical protein